MSTTSNVGFLTVEEARAELNLFSPVLISRLIARGRIQGNRLGDTGPTRIPVDSLDKYIRTNCPDLKPVADPDEQWFTARDQYLAGQFRAAVIEAAKPQVLPDATVRKLFADAPLETSITVPLKLTPEIRALIDQKPTRGPFDPRPNEASPYKNWGELYLVWEIRDVAAQVVRKVTGKTPLEKLYAGPADYRRITADAVERAKARRIAFSTQHLIDTRGTGERRTVFYTLDNTALTAPGNWPRLVELAF
jgi:hypothetical protein